MMKKKYCIAQSERNNELFFLSYIVKTVPWGKTDRKLSYRRSLYSLVLRARFLRSI